MGNNLFVVIGNVIEFDFGVYLVCQNRDRVYLMNVATGNVWDGDGCPYKKYPEKPVYSLDDLGVTAINLNGEPKVYRSTFEYFESKIG